MSMMKSLSPEIDLNTISQIAVFHNIAPCDMQQIRGLLRRKTFAAGTTLMMVEQSGEAVYFVSSGTLKVHVEQADGTDVIISILGPGEMVGEMAALDNAGRSASVVTLEESVMLWMDRASFRHCLETIPVMAFNLACTLAARLRLANGQIQALAALDAECRVARQILAFSERYGQPQPGGDIHIPIRLTQSDIACMVGATREHVNKILVSYKERGYLSVDTRYHIVLHDQGALTRRCGRQ
jgi:CRP/FNR family cyclic AMP-dependent transcriptional regulator